mmetsp:Transcript_119002/g.237239  ORF Transcript_119002/g.237239 Transcript_119002/m.237239 type:complete len:210 (-) Transcript_119002:928-1557(-)
MACESSLAYSSVEETKMAVTALVMTNAKNAMYTRKIENVGMPMMSSNGSETSPQFTPPVETLKSVYIACGTESHVLKRISSCSDCDCPSPLSPFFQSSCLNAAMDWTKHMPNMKLVPVITMTVQNRGFTDPMSELSSSRTSRKDRMTRSTRITFIILRMRMSRTWVRLVEEEEMISNQPVHTMATSNQLQADMKKITLRAMMRITSSIV